MLKKILFIVDVDNTLIDTDALKRAIASKFNILIYPRKDINFWKFYEEARTKPGLVKISDITIRLSNKLKIKSKLLENLFYNHKFKKYLYPQSVILLKKLKKLGNVIILSLGEKSYHQKKIRQSGLEKIVGAKNVILATDKLTAIKKINSSRSKKYDKVIVIDDRSDMLENIWKLQKKTTTVWVRQGKYKNILPAKKSSITFTLKRLSQVSLTLASYVDTLPQSPFGRQWSVLRGITSTNIIDLINYTNHDKKIAKYTHDQKRFISKKSFHKWIKDKKVIFTLVDNEQKLAGIIWFSKKPFQKVDKADYNYTFAIRLYSIARGKKLAFQFMKIAFDTFCNDLPKINKFWLTTKVNNIPALKLYNKFGFKEEFQSRGKTYMTLDF